MADAQSCPSSQSNLATRETRLHFISAGMTFRRCGLHQKGGVAGHTAVEHLHINLYLYAEYHIYLSLNTISILASFSYGPRPSSYSYENLRETNKVPLGIASDTITDSTSSSEARNDRPDREFDLFFLRF
jgi:hypothetical protein